MIISMAFPFYQGQEMISHCSIYAFYMRSSISWEESKNMCKKSGSTLVSMERLTAELSFLKNHLETLKKSTTEYYIGLRKYGQKWMWISDNSTFNKTEKGKFPWDKFEPSGTGNCSKMWLKENIKWTYVFDDIDCYSSYNIGYICERSLTSSECGSNGE